MTGRLKIAMLIALLVGLCTVFLINEIAINRYPPVWTLPDGRNGPYDPASIRACMGARALAALGDRSSASHWHRCATALHQQKALGGFSWRYWAVICTSFLTLVAAFGFAFAVRFDRPAHRVLRGRHHLTGQPARRAFMQSAKSEIAQSGQGLTILPGLTISRERETRHWLIWGSVGAGKTQTMLHLILAAIARGDGVLVIDVKGDMTATLPGDPLLVAPQDAHSLVWDVARDCRTKQDARELATRLIPDSHDLMWVDAAREVLIVCVATLQATMGERWTWHDLHALGTAKVETLLAMARRYHVDAVRLLENPDSRTTQSVLSTFQAQMHGVATLGDAWSRNDNGRFSVTEWLHHPTPHRPVILQHDPRNPGLSNIWIGGLLALLAASVGSPSVQESRARRIWIFADEFPQLPKLNTFATVLDLGRSKGVIAVLCAHDLAQLRATYGHERANAWLGMIGTKIITRINAGPGAEEASRMIGDQEVERDERSDTVVGGRAIVTTSRRRETRRVITADEIATRSGPRADDMRVLMVGLGRDALELAVPYVTLPILRPGHMAAAWSKPRTEPSNLTPDTPAPLRLLSPLSKAVAERIRELGE
jgi:Type IV secretion-system coupling protein DNA-binding domain